MPRYHLLETAEYDEYARWCERGSREAAPYSIIASQIAAGAGQNKRAVSPDGFRYPLPKVFYGIQPGAIHRRREFSRCHLSNRSGCGS